MSVYLLAAVRREHRRLTAISQGLDRRATPPGVVRLVEGAMLDLDEAAHLLEHDLEATPPGSGYVCACGVVCEDPSEVDSFAEPCTRGGFHAWRSRT
jgi:hypothetical protein